MKHILSISGLLLVTALMLSGCKSSKTVQSGKMPDAVPAFDVNAYKNRVVARAARPSALTARLALTLKAGTKEISVNGSLRMQRDDVIQLSLTFLGMEVGRMEFTQQDVLLVDRFNKQYVRVPYGELDFLQRARLDFEALQALFWNELFVPGSSGKLSELMSRFKVSEYGDYVRFVLDDAPQRFARPDNYQRKNVRRRDEIRRPLWRFHRCVGLHVPYPYPVRCGGVAAGQLFARYDAQPPLDV